MHFSFKCTAIWYSTPLTLHSKSYNETTMWIIFTVFFMLFLLSNEEKQRRESNSATNQEQNHYEKERERAMAA